MRLYAFLVICPSFTVITAKEHALFLNLFAVSDGIRRKTKIYEQFQVETEKKSIFSTGFRRLRIEKRKSLFRRQKNNFLISNWSNV